MAVLSHGSLQNVYASLDAYVTARIVEGSGVITRLHGVRRFVPPVDDPWCEVIYDFLGLQSQFRRQTGRYVADAQVFATEMQGYIQVNIYQRARFWNTRYTLAAARDAVKGAFPEGSIVSIYDYASGMDTTEVGCIILDECQEHVQDHGIQSGLVQHVMQVASRYLEHFVR